jgi:teichuronic acid biosynthesis glycosyltransferase TuaG
MTRVSILMPAHNAAATLSKAIDSVTGQAFSDWELIIIDDASSDATAAIASTRAAKDERIRVLQLSQNVGVARARNAGIDCAGGEFLAFLDADDSWTTDKLMTQFDDGENIADFSYMAYQHVDAVGEPGSVVVPPTRLDYTRLLDGNQIGTLTVAIRRELLGDLRFPLRHHEDYALWLRLVKRAGHAERRGDGRPYAYYRTTVNSVSGRKLQTVGWTWSIYRDQERLGVLQSARHLAHHLVRGINKHYF